MQCTDLIPQAAQDICIRNMRTKFQKYFVAVAPKSYTKIMEKAQSAEAVTARETQEKSVRKNYKLIASLSVGTPTKRKKT